MPLAPRSFVKLVTQCRLAGFSLVEVIVALAVILILAAVALPSLAGFLDQKRIDETSTQLLMVRDALYNPVAGTNGFYQKILSNAGRLSELDSVIISGNNSYATGTDDSCGNTFTATERTRWINNGPFMTHNSERTSGMITPVGRAEDSLTRFPPGGGGTFGVLRLNFLDNVALSDAIMLDSTMEGGDGFDAGLLRWLLPPNAEGLVTMQYFVVINTVC